LTGNVKPCCTPEALWRSVREKRLEAHCPEKPKQEVDIRQGALNFKRFQTFSRRSAFPRHTHRYARPCTWSRPRSGSGISSSDFDWRPGGCPRIRTRHVIRDKRRASRVAESFLEVLADDILGVEENDLPSVREPAFGSAHAVVPFGHVRYPWDGEPTTKHLWASNTWCSRRPST
jgi:hypothetical protein